MSTGHPWEMYSTMTVQKNSGFQWSRNFSQLPSAMGNKELDIPSLISEQNTEIRRDSFIVAKTNVWRQQR